MINRMKINANYIKNCLDDLARSALCSALKVLFSETEKKLFVRAEHLDNSAEKNQILDQIHHLKRTTEQFERAFITKATQPDQRIPRDWYALYKNRTTAIQIEDMISHARAKFGIELAQYESRIKWLHQNYPDLFSENLYTLPGLVSAYLENINLFDSTTQENLTRIIGHQFLNKLEPMYILMNDLLIQNGALPEIKSLRKSSSSALDDLLEEMALSEASLNEEIIQSRTITKSELLQQLSSLLTAGKELLPRKSIWSAETFYRALLKHLNLAGTQIEFAPKETESIMLAGTILSGMLNDRLINPTIKSSIAQLQTIILYTALDDDGFFSQPKHPARAVLNKLAIIGSDPAQNKNTLQKIPELIDEFIKNEIKIPPIDLSILLKKISATDQGEFQNSLPQEDIQSTQNQTLIARSRQRVSELIRHEVKGQSLHLMTQQFIEQILAPFMVHILMAHGRQCSEWTQGLTLLQELIEIDNHPISAKKILATISHIYELVDYPFFHSGGMTAELFGSGISQIVDYLESQRDKIPPPQLISPITDETQPHTTVDVADFATATPPPQANIIPVNEPTEALIPEKTSPAAEEPPVLAKTIEVSRFTVSTMADVRTQNFIQRFILNGEWLQIFTAEGAALRRLKANQINQDLCTINFSNRNGEIALVLPLVQFFDDLVQGRSHPVFDNLAFNKALAQLVETLDADRPR